MISRYAPKKFTYDMWKENIHIFPMFYSMLADEEKLKLLKDENFREYIVNDASTGNLLVKVVDFANKKDLKTLFDDCFIDFIFTNNTSQILTLLSTTKTDISDILVKYSDKFFANPKYLCNIDILFKHLNFEQRLEIFTKYVGEFEFDNCILAKFLHLLYPSMYEYELEHDYSKNEKAIAEINKLLKNKNIAKRLYEDYSLISELDPANRSILFIQKEYYKMTYDEKKILFKLLKEKVDTTLTEKILFDGDFIEDVACIKDVVTYRNILQTLKLNNPRVVELVEIKRNEFYDYYINKFKTEDSEDFVDSNDEIVSHCIVDYIFDRYFQACSTDSIYSACVIFDALNIKGFDEHITKEGFKVINKLKDLFIYLTNHNKFPSDLNESVERRDEDLIIKLKELVDLMNKIPNFAKKFANLMKTARKMFESQVQKGIKSLNLEKKENNKGVVMYEIDYNTPFYMLIHSQTVIDAVEEVIMPEIPQNRHIIDVSMSLLDSGHMVTYGDEYLSKDTCIDFGYTKLSDDSLKHAFPKDSFTNLADKHGNIPRLDVATSKYPPTYIDLDTFMTLTNENNFNELKIHATANTQNKHGKGIMRPSYILCRDKVGEYQIEISKKFNIPIVFVDTSKLSKRQHNNNYEPTLSLYNRGEYVDKSNPLIV